MATHSSTLAWKIPWTEEPGGLQSWGREELDTTERLHFHVSLSCIGEGNGNPLQCSCLENPRDGEAWWAAVCGVAQSRTRLKRLSSSSSSTLLSTLVYTDLYICVKVYVHVIISQNFCIKGYVISNSDFAILFFQEVILVYTPASSIRGPSQWLPVCSRNTFCPV